MGPVGAEGPASGCSRHSPLTQDSAFRDGVRLGLLQHTSRPCAVTGWEETPGWGWREGRRAGHPAAWGCYWWLSSKELITTAGPEARRLEMLACPGPASLGG